MGQLNELQIKAAAPRDKEYLLADGDGLYLRVRPTGKVWVYRYKQFGKEAKLTQRELAVSFPDDVGVALSLDIDMVLQQDPFDWAAHS